MTRIKNFFQLPQGFLWVFLKNHTNVVQQKHFKSFKFLVISKNWKRSDENLIHFICFTRKQCKFYQFSNNFINLHQNRIHSSHSNIFHISKTSRFHTLSTIFFFKQTLKSCKFLLLPTTLHYCGVNVQSVKHEFTGENWFFSCICMEVFEILFDFLSFLSSFFFDSKPKHSTNNDI